MRRRDGPADARSSSGNPRATGEGVDGFPAAPMRCPGCNARDPAEPRASAGYSNNPVVLPHQASLFSVSSRLPDDDRRPRRRTTTSETFTEQALSTVRTLATILTRPPLVAQRTNYPITPPTLAYIKNPHARCRLWFTGLPPANLPVRVAERQFPCPSAGSGSAEKSNNDGGKATFPSQSKDESFAFLQDELVET